MIDNGPWLLDGVKPIALKEWEPGMKMDWSSFNFVPVWVILPDLDPIFLSQHMLSVIGSMIGSPICMDKFTTSKKRLSYARILVNVNAEEVKCKEVVLIGPDDKQFRQSVQFEWCPWVCESCKVFGHSTAYCGRKIKLRQDQKAGVQKVWRVKEKSVLGPPPIEAVIDDSVNKNDDQVVDTVVEGNQSVANGLESELNTVMLPSAEMFDVEPKAVAQGNVPTHLTKYVEQANVDIGESSSKNEKNGKNQQDKGWKEAKGRKQKNSPAHYELRQRVQNQKGVPSIAMKNKYVPLDRVPSSLTKPST